MREYNGKQYENRQQRIWLFMLYPDNNPTHKIAIEKVLNYPGSIVMYHDKSYAGEEKKDNHYHCSIQFDSPKWLFTLMDELGLENDSIHLFKSLKDLKYKRLEDNIIYVTHIKEPDKEIYDPELFLGTNRNYAIDVVKNMSLTDSERFKNLLWDLELLQQGGNLWSMTYINIYDYLCSKGHEYILYKKWFYVRNFIDDAKGGIYR